MSLPDKGSSSINGSNSHASNASSGSLSARSPPHAPARLLPSPMPPPGSSSSLSSQRPTSGISAVSLDEKAALDQADGAPSRKSHSHSISSNPRTVTSVRSTTSAENRERRRSVRTLPPWVQLADEDEEDYEKANLKNLLLPRTPTSIRPASHNHMPTPKENAPAGRHFDHAREGTPVTITAPLQLNGPQWRQFTKATAYPQPPSSRGQVVDDEWMKENLPDLEAPWQPMDQNDDKEDEGFWLLNASRRRRRVMRFRRTLLNHPMVPLVIRLTVFTFSALALGLAGSIFHRSDSAGCQNNSSTWLAVIVDVIAIIYIVYITYDEYTSKPLGLRSHSAKLRLIFLDLLFIVFDSANLSLAFQALTDERWACHDGELDVSNSCPYSQDICVRQKALTATLLIALVAWLTTFGISTMRLVERVAR